jgi:DNA-directed RNA polymerase subunit RPC12/RpoP
LTRCMECAIIIIKGAGVGHGPETAPKEETMESFQVKCEECGAHYTCKWCGGTWFKNVPAGTLCAACSTLTDMGNASMEHDYSQHHKKYKCWHCGKVFNTELGYENHMENEHFFIRDKWGIWR